MVETMRTTIDRAGRLVIPKPLRERLGLLGGVEVEIRESADGLSIVPLAAGPALVERDGLVVVESGSGTVITDDDVRPLRDEGRR
jgi:AbrB family looped-hinge helix DNA binding protein